MITHARACASVITLKYYNFSISGQSHNRSYNLYHIGEVSRQSVRNFAQFGKLDDLVQEGDGDQRVYDQFSAPSVGDGIGETGNMVFVDGEHSLVSVEL